MSEPALHVVLGAGQIGSALAELLLAAGHRVRLVRRSEPGRARPGLSWATGNLEDLAFAEEATRGAAVVYDCTNPAYTEWASHLVPLGRGALHGARAAGAKLVALDNLYMYGQVDGPMREDTPVRPVSRKGELRARLAGERLEAMARGELRVAIARASDFFGPGVTLGVFGDRFFRRVFACKGGEVLGDPDQPHAYTYGPDVARALATLGGDADVVGVWHVPTNPAESTRALAARLGRALGRDVPLTRAPDWMLRGLGLFSPMMRELAEMTYQWRAPFLLDDSKFRARYGWGPTPWDEAAKATAALAAATYGARAAA